MNKTNKIIIILLLILTTGVIVTLYKTFNTNEGIEIRTNDNYIQYKALDSDEWKDLIKLETLTGKSGKEVEIKRDGDYIKWKYKGENNWINLVNINSLVGKNGKDGENGVDGKDIEVSTDEEYIIYRYKDSEEWTKLVKLSSLNGKDGSNGKDGIDGIDGKNGIDGKDGIDGIDGKDGIDGIDGINGTNGKEIEITKDETYIKWRYKGDETWNNLVELSSIKGEDGNIWINLGTVNTSEYCKTRSECGYLVYLNNHFPEADEGNYIFTDNENNYMWHVKVEKSEISDNKFALIEYWSTNEIIPKYISATLTNGETKWNTKNYSYVTIDNFDTFVNEVANRFNKSGIKSIINYSVDTHDITIKEYFNNKEKFGNYSEYEFIGTMGGKIGLMYTARAKIFINNKVYIEYRVYNEPSILYYFEGTVNDDNTITYGNLKSKN